jgi:tetraacyldisaccharide 4'-kinase
MPDARWRRGLENAWYRGARWLYVLRPLEYLFLSLAAFRRSLYRFGVLPTQCFQTPVVIVGNLALGGTGKTPFVLALVQALSERGIRAGVVARGYGANVGTGPRIVSTDSAVELVGDEALMLVRRTGCPCVVHPSRKLAVRHLLASFDVDIVLSDDGLQHYALGRELEIVLYDTQRGFGNGRCLPAGPLREPLSRLAQVDYVLGRGFDRDKADFVLAAGALVNLASGERVKPLDFAAGDARRGKVMAIAGIANPGQFSKTLRDLGIAHDLNVFSDHHAYTAEDFSGLTYRTVIMTEKDAIKCRSLAGPQAWYLELYASVPGDVLEHIAGLAMRQG